MKFNLSFNKLLHNYKLMVIVSVLTALAIWAAVHSVSGEDVITISKTANLTLDNTYAGSTGLKIFSGASLQVDTKVRGSLFVIYKLNESNIEIRGDYSDIKGVGDWDVTLSAAKSGDETDYTIIEVIPRKARVFCDYEDSKTFAISPNIKNVAIKEDTGYQLGPPVVQGEGIENGTIKIHGPKSVISRIAAISAEIDQSRTISEVATFQATLVAYDEKGEPVDISLCEFEGLTSADNKVNVIVPVHVKRRVDFTYKFNNIPSGLKNLSNFIKISPSHIEIIGAPEQVETFADDIANLGTFDFNHIGLEDRQKKIELNIPQGIGVIDGTTEVTVSFNMENFTSKTIDLEMNSSNTSVIRRPAGRSYQLATQKIGVKLIGSKQSIEKIKASNLSAVIDMADDPTTGVREFRAMIRVSGFDDVWVYYGESEPSGYQIYMNVS